MFVHRLIRLRSLAWLLTMGALAIGASSACGQQAVGVPPQGVAAAAANGQPIPAGVGQAVPGGPNAQAPTAHEHKSLFEILRSGGLMMIPLLSCSFVMLVFVFERLISLRRGRVIPGPFVKRLLPQLREGKLDRDAALALCQESKSPVGDVLAAGVKKWGRPAVEVEQALIDAGERVSHRLRRYLRLFNGLATVSPLLGLLGTVFGIMRLFNAVASSDAMGRAELLAGGISEALLTTAAGLGVAAPAVCFYLFFLSRSDQFLIEMDALGQELVEAVSAEALQEGRARSRRAAA
jgi:biopolymer transport protein ExbB